MNIESNNNNPAFRPSRSWHLPNSSSDQIHLDWNCCDTNSGFANSGHHAFANQPDPTGVCATASQIHTHGWSPNLSSPSLGSQQQALDTVYNEGTTNITIASPVSQLDSQWFPQSPDFATPSFIEPYFPSLGSVNDDVNSYANTYAQPDQAYQFANNVDAPNVVGVTNFDVAWTDTTNFEPSNEWLDYPAFEPQVDMNSYVANLDVAPMGTTRFGSSNQWSTFTNFEPQLDNTSFISLPNTTYMSSPPVLPTPATVDVPAAATFVNTNPNTCNFPGCGKVFGRAADLARHGRKHVDHQHPCPVNGCSKTFYRTDKLRDHQRKGHKMSV